MTPDQNPYVRAPVQQSIYENPTQMDNTRKTPWQFYAEKKGYDPVLVGKVWQAAEAQGMSPTMALALVSHESRFNPDAINVNKDRTVDKGLFQLNSYYHHQFEGNIDGHIQYGMKFLADNIRRYGTAGGLGVYNVGASQEPDKKAARAEYVGKVMAEYNDLKRTMVSYAALDPNFKMSMLSPQEQQAMQKGGK
jgi:soluble lytic murein transglycosylase-like protein